MDVDQPRQGLGFLVFLHFEIGLLDAGDGQVFVHHPDQFGPGLKSLAQGHDGLGHGG
jgi:hypothetical protein